MHFLREKLVFFAIFLAAIILFFTALILFHNNIKKQTKICFKNYCFNAELAITPKERRRGLMFRDSLDSDGGMLFIFEKEGEYPFWMKNTLIPLDIIWLNGDKEIVFISNSIQPCAESFCSAIMPGKKAAYVLEINGGMAKKIGLAVGDKINFK